MFVLANTWFQTLMRQFFFNIDKIVFNFISILYDLLTTIARKSVLSQADILAVADRIYKLLAVFMVFKVTFSLIMYVVNPDDFSDKTKGVGKLGFNIVISLSLLILTPYFFNYAYRLQTYILEDNSLATLVYGDTDETYDSFHSAGDTMAFISMMPFFSPNTAIKEQYECGTLTLSDGSINPSCFGYDKNLNSVNNSNTMYKLFSTNEDLSESTLKDYADGVQRGNFGLMFRQDIAVAAADDEYVIDYRYIFSTVVGVIICLLLISFCMDVAVRSIKLAFLQIIAPIPIISYVDPKSGKDGLFKKWYQTCFKTFISLFIRLLAIYFASFIISKVDKMVDIVDGSYGSTMLVKIFVIIGALMFAKQLPKILEGLGIKLDGDGKFTLNPVKKFEEGALGAKRITGAAGGLLAAASDRVARLATEPGVKNKLKALAGTGTGLLGGAIRGASANGGFIAGRDRQADVNRRLRYGRINGLSPTASYLDYYASKLGMDDATLEREATITQRNRDAIDEGRRELDAENRVDSQRVKEIAQENATRKTTRTRFDNVKKQGSRLINLAEDVASKKADLGVSETDQNIVNYLKAHKGQVNGLSTDSIKAKYIDANGQVKFRTIAAKGAVIDDTMIAEMERYANREMYTSNRRSNEANLKFLNEHQGETLTRAFTIGNETFKAGDVIDGSLIAKAKAAEGAYIKESQKAVFNELAKGENSRYAASDTTKNDEKSFRNASQEYDQAVADANAAIAEYNEQYREPGKPDLTTINTGHGSYSQVKEITNDMDNGDASVEVNTGIAKADNETDVINRRIESRKQSKQVVYYDENNRSEQVNIDDADSRNKPREERLKREKEKHKNRRDFRGDINMFRRGGGKK